MRASLPYSPSAVLKTHLSPTEVSHFFLKEPNPNTRPSLPACNEIWWGGQQCHWVSKEKKKEEEEMAFVSWLALMLLWDRGSGSHTVESLCPEYSCLLRGCQLAPQLSFSSTNQGLVGSLSTQGWDTLLVVCWWCLFPNLPPWIMMQQSISFFNVQHSHL